MLRRAVEPPDQKDQLGQLCSISRATRAGRGDGPLLRQLVRCGPAESATVTVAFCMQIFIEGRSGCRQTLAAITCHHHQISRPTRGPSAVHNQSWLFPVRRSRVVLRPHHPSRVSRIVRSFGLVHLSVLNTWLRVVEPCGTGRSEIQYIRPSTEPRRGGGCAFNCSILVTVRILEWTVQWTVQWTKR